MKQILHTFFFLFIYSVTQCISTEHDQSFYKQHSQKLRAEKKYHEALDMLQEATAFWPKNISFLFDLSHSAIMIGQAEQAIAAYKKILALRPNSANIFHNIGYTLRMKGDPESAIDFYDQALHANPQLESARFARALAYLNNGDFQSGWKDYEQHQLHSVNFNPDDIRTWLQNNELAGKRILIHPQGGFGDTFQFIRYAEELKKKNAYIIVKTKKPLQPFLSSCCPYLDEVVTNRADINFDAQTSVMTLPALFNSSEETIPKTVPYLFPDPDLVQKWKSFFESTPQKIVKVGICWTADEKHDESRPPVGNRSIPLALLEPLNQFTNVEFYSLQKNTPDCSQLLPHGPEIKTFGPDFDKTHGAFMDTAAIMKHLDLVISVDTSIAHLAGALGVPIWTLLPFSVDWRWIAGRTDSPWYPTMRLFKQQEPLGWKPVIEKIAVELKKQESS